MCAMALEKASWNSEQTRVVLEEVVLRSEPAGTPWRVLEGLATAPRLAVLGERLYRVLTPEAVGSGYVLGLLGAHYELDCLQRSWPKPVQSLVKDERGQGRYHLLAVPSNQPAQPLFPLMTLLEDRLGDFHVLETRFGGNDGFWALFSMATQLLVESVKDPARFDDFGDFQMLGAPSVVQRHSTERLSKHLSQRVVHDPRLCNHCLRCVTACSEMLALVSDRGARLLGPSESHCTNCGLCRKRCALLLTQPKKEPDQARELRQPMHEGGRAVHLYGQAAKDYRASLESLSKSDPPWFPYVFRPSLAIPDPMRGSYAVDTQWELSLRGTPEPSGLRPMVVTIGNGGDPDAREVIVRSRCQMALVLQTGSGAIERDLMDAAMRLGMSVRAVLDLDSEGDSNSLLAGNVAARLLYETGHFLQEGLEELWESGKVDLFVAPYAQRLPLGLQQRILEATGRLAQVLAPHIRQALPVTQSPLLTQFNKSLLEIFTRHPELLETEAQLASELLQDIQRNHALLHARYRAMALASGHTACPTCAEVQVLAIPAYMAIAMSLARGEIPHVVLTMETGCMSETLNKANEVAQKVPGGRTVFGGGFAFGEAMTMAQDRSIRLGHLPKGRRYVVSQGGDGGAVIGLPAWLNALRQQATLIRRRQPNVLHFMNITDTQVYSNTGGESSASSLLGMGTLTTPIGKFLMGNQNVQWTLINLAAEFPGVLVGAGHSANRVAIQQFWQLADRLGQSGIRWDVTPCPETGKFFGEDPDDLAEVMAHAGMLPEVVFVGRMRKRIGPYHPDDRGKPFDAWRRTPQPILYWLQRDPRYRALLQRDRTTGKVEPRNLVASFLITELESFRDQMNGQIDLETRLVLKAEQRVRVFLDEIKTSWQHYRYHLERFHYTALFDDRGDWKPQLAVSLEHEMVRRSLGWDELQRYSVTRDQVLHDQQPRLSNYLQAIHELEKQMEPLGKGWEPQSDTFREELEKVRQLQHELHQEALKLEKHHATLLIRDPVEEEIFRSQAKDAQGTGVWQHRRLQELLDRILAERALAQHTELQQYRLAQQLKDEFIRTGGLIRAQHAVASVQGRAALRAQIAAMGPFAVGVASLAGDRGIAINRIFANFFTAKGAWAGMAWQFGSSKRGTPVLSATFVDSKPLQRKDAMYSFPMAVLTVTNFEEMKRQPDLFFGQLEPGGFLIVNQRKPADLLWRELVEHYPADIRQLAMELRAEYHQDRPSLQMVQPDARAVVRTDDTSAGPTAAIRASIAQRLWGQTESRLNMEQQRLVRKMTAMVCAQVISVDMDGIMREVSGTGDVVSNLVAIGPMFQALQAKGFDFDWSRDLSLLSQGFPEAVLKNSKLLDQYYQAMERARERSGLAELQASSLIVQGSGFGVETPGGGSRKGSRESDQAMDLAEDPGEYLMIMGGTLAGMVLSQVALPEHPLFYVGFPITPAGNPFYAMAEAYANGHPYIVVDEVNPSEKVAAEKLIGIARVGGFLPVTFTASQGWRLFTEIIPQFVGARLEGLFLITKRALAAPNLNIEESHTDFMSFRDDGGIMLAPKGIQDYVATLYLARLLTHFAKLPVIVSIGGITDTHKIGLVKVPDDQRVRTWLQKTLAGFDFLEHKILNRQGDILVHGPSGTSAVYQETQSEIEKAHMTAARIYPYALQAVHELTGVRIDELEVQCQGNHAVAGGREPSVTGRGKPSQAVGPAPETLLVLQGSLYPNAVEALRNLEEAGWTGMGCVSVRCFNPFPEEALAFWLNQARRIVVLDRSNSFGSIPPLASRVFTTWARRWTGDEGSRRPVLRTLVGGLGGREITVDEMKDILLSTHLLIRAGQPWEEPLIAQWLAEDEVLRTLLAEAAALDWRNVQRHTRVPEHLRSFAASQMEYRRHLERLGQVLIRKDYPAFLANYHQVEFVAPREVLQETTLLQQIVIHLEVKLARHALASGLGDWRHALVLLHYGRDGRDLDSVVAALRGGIEEGGIRPDLPQHYGMAAALGQGSQSIRKPLEVVEDAGELFDAQGAPAVVDSIPGEGGCTIVFDEAEAARVEAIIQELVQLQSTRPLLFNPEDYEHELFIRLQVVPESPLFSLGERHPAEAADQLCWAYRKCYQEVFHRALQWEVLSQHHAPELKELFAGDGLCRLQVLADKFATALADNPLEQSPAAIQAELERYLMERCIPNYPHYPIVYLEYFRTWVAPELIRKAMATQETAGTV
ncbi:MAG TPA: hypothetical protein DEO88_10070 [Syntrophobacteraceae bacterium]|nr:hypothetical protein [Syntrophobacteraceae bacterium]